MTKEKLNQQFTAGEEAILEQAVSILNRRHSKYYSKYFRYSKKLILVGVEE